MRRWILLGALSVAAGSTVSCQSCPPREVQVGDRVRVVVGAPLGNPGDATCDALEFGVGAEFTGEITDHSLLESFEGGPWAQTCAYHRFSGPMSVDSDWRFEPREGGGASIWGGAFRAQLRDECTGLLVLSVDGGDEDRLWVMFSPETGSICPEACSSHHVVTVEFLGGQGSAGAGGDGSASGGSFSSVDGTGGSGGEPVVASGGSSGSAAGGVNASGGAGGSDGSLGLDPGLEQRMQALCDADCSNFDEVKECRPTRGSNQQECWSNCYSAVKDTFHARCPEELLVLFECLEEHPGALDFSCDGTTLLSADSSCEPATLALRDCVAEREGQ
jgi:hypothetical protein